jgi:hypothetical protein
MRVVSLQQVSCDHLVSADAALINIVYGRRNSVIIAENSARSTPVISAVDHLYNNPISRVQKLDTSAARR